MTDQQIIDALIDRDERVTKHFFFEKCRPLFISIMNNVFTYEVDFDEIVNALYLYLMENDAYRLRQFEGRSSIYQWLKVTAIRFFIAKRNNMIDTTSKEHLLDNVERNETVDTAQASIAKLQLEQLLSCMRNKRFVYVIRRLMIDDAKPQDVASELNIKVSNVYNIKARAMESLTQAALKEIDKYNSLLKEKRQQS